VSKLNKKLSLLRKLNVVARKNTEKIQCAVFQQMRFEKVMSLKRDSGQDRTRVYIILVDCTNFVIQKSKLNLMNYI